MIVSETNDPVGLDIAARIADDHSDPVFAAFLRQKAQDLRDKELAKQEKNTL